jgi:hypothetical protein
VYCAPRHIGCTRLMMDIALAVSVITRQLSERGPLPEDNVATVVANAFGAVPTVEELRGVAAAAAPDINRSPAGEWSMAAEDGLVYAAGKRGGAVVKRLPRGQRLFFRAHSSRLLATRLRLLAPGVVGLPTDTSRHSAAAVVAAAGPAGVPVAEAPEGTAAAVDAGELIYLAGRVWAVPPGPAFSPAAARLWRDTVGALLKKTNAAPPGAALRARKPARSARRTGRRAGAAAPRGCTRGTAASAPRGALA